MFSHFLRNRTHSNTREVVDREPRILGVIHREHLAAEMFDFGILEPIHNGHHPHALHDLSKHNLDENSGGGSRFILIHLNGLKKSPGKRIRSKEVTEKPSDIPESVRLVPMYCLVVFAERLFKSVSPHAVDLGESLSDEAIELAVRTFLGATLDDHLHELDLFGWY